MFLFKEELLSNIFVSSTADPFFSFVLCTCLKHIIWLIFSLLGLLYLTFETNVSELGNCKQVDQSSTLPHH